MHLCFSERCFVFADAYGVCLFILKCGEKWFNIFFESRCLFVQFERKAIKLWYLQYTRHMLFVNAGMLENGCAECLKISI